MTTTAQTTTVAAKTNRVWLSVGIASGVALAMTIALLVVGNMLTSEYWCADRSPWWGPPQNPDSSCTGDAWATDHPGEYPWTLPR